MTSKPTIVTTMIPPTLTSEEIVELPRGLEYKEFVNQAMDSVNRIVFVRSALHGASR
ncbi:hypothetical protein ACFL48_00250 [Pseudomonadota bacterium]